MFFCSRLPHPAPTWQNPALTTHASRAELADASSPIIRSPERPGPPTTSGCGRADHANRMRTRTGEKERWGVKEAPWGHSCPLHCFLQERLLAEVRQQLWISRPVFFGGRDYFHRKNIFIDENQAFYLKAWWCFAHFFCFACHSMPETGLEETLEPVIKIKLWQF